MLEKLDLTLSVAKSEFKKKSKDLMLKLGDLQRKAKDSGLPVVVVFEGWDAAGKGSCINFVIQGLDPRGFKVWPINTPNEEEAFRPFLWRFWTKLPAKGQIAIFDRSWYGRVLVDNVDGRVEGKTLDLSYKEIKNFEKTLVDDGSVLIKFWLHINQKEQKKRFKRLEKNPATRWKVGKEDRKRNKQYPAYYDAVEEMIQRTSTEQNPWTLVEAHESDFARLKVLETIVGAIESGLKNKSVPARVSIPVKIDTDILKSVRLDVAVGRAVYERKLEKLQRRAHELEHRIYVKRVPVVIAFEGCDAAGKGGAIKRLTQRLDPRGYEVIPIAAPAPDEKARPFLYRFWKHIPKAGHMTIFDRTWYGRVLVERVEKFCSEPEWMRAYREINDFESQLVSFGTVLVKFWMQISKDEQLRRFKARQEDTHKTWKITEEDWRNREKWPLYEKAVNDMLANTSTKTAPWTVVESNDKYYARLKVLETVNEAIKKSL